MSEEPTEEAVSETTEEQPSVLTEATPEAPPVPRDPSQDEDPTYAVEIWSGLTKYYCLLDEHEDWNFETFRQHMQVYHRDILREAPPGPGPQDPAPAAMDEAEAGSGQAAETATADAATPAEAPANEAVC